MLKLNGYFTGEGIKERERTIKELSDMRISKGEIIIDLIEEVYENYEFVSSSNFDSEKITFVVMGDECIEPTEVTINII